ncbi:MAG: hypothetical protein WC908_02255 [Candidatus Paceibacterota bacterium]
MKKIPRSKNFLRNLNEANCYMSKLGLESNTPYTHREVLLKLREDESLSENQKEYCYYVLYLSWMKFFEPPLEKNIDIWLVIDFSFFSHDLLYLKYKKFFYTAKYRFELETDYLLKKFIKQKVQNTGIQFCKDACRCFERETPQELYYYRSYFYGLWEDLFIEKLKIIVPDYSDLKITVDDSFKLKLTKNESFIDLFLYDAPPTYQVSHIKDVSNIFKNCNNEQLQKYLELVQKRFSFLEKKNEIVSDVGRLEIQGEILLWNTIIWAINKIKC